MPERWQRRPEGSTWGDFGPDDQLGRLNLITPAKVRAAVAEVTEGISFCLSLPLDYPGEPPGTSRSRKPPILRPVLRNGKPSFGYALSQDTPELTDVICDDAAVLHLQYSTHWDALCHVGHLFDLDGDGEREMAFYNGYRFGHEINASSDPADAGADGTFTARQTTDVGALDIANTAATGVQGRGVLIDLAAHFGRGRTIVGYDELRHVLDTDGIDVGEGDLVCLHTGYAQTVLEMNRMPDHDRLRHETGAGLDGRDKLLLDWVTETALTALIADNSAVEIHPYPGYEVPAPHAALPLHEHCLFKLGVHIGELFYLTELANWLRERGRSRFLLTAPPLRLPGAVGSPVTPVATV